MTLSIFMIGWGVFWLSLWGLLLYGSLKHHGRDDTIGMAGLGIVVSGSWTLAWIMTALLIGILT